MKFGYRLVAVGVFTVAVVTGAESSAWSATKFSPVTSSGVPNGDFEADPVGSTSITSWTVMNETIDLGVTPIAGCLSVDTSDYSTLRDYDAELEKKRKKIYNKAYDDAYNGAYADALDAAFDEVPTGVSGIVNIVNASDNSSVYLFTSPLLIPLAYDYNENEYAAEDLPGSFLGQYWWDQTYQDALAAILQPVKDAAHASADAIATAARDAYVPPVPTVRQDNVSTIPGFFDELEYKTKVVDSASSYYLYDTDDPLGRDGKVLELFSDVGGDQSNGAFYEGYVSHGPAAYSDVFTVPAGRQISLDWFAAGVNDDFHVFGYLLNTDTCEQTEVVDATGKEQAWTTTSVSIPAAGSYRFVFVSGTFDKTFGSSAGALLYIDNIVESVDPAYQPELAKAGSDNLTPLLIGTGVLAAGLGLLLLARRRTRHGKG